MVNVRHYADTYNEDGNNCLTYDATNQYATEVAKEAIQAYIKTQGGTKMSIETDGINKAAQAVLSETQTSAALIGGEILLENIEVIADKLILSKLNWWQRFSITKKNKELAVTLATYAIVHAIKTGGFGLTKYKVNHAALDYVTLAANTRLLKFVVQSTGVDTNMAAALFKAPTISTEG